MHCEAKSTAVSKPNVDVVLSRSLSTVLGTPTRRSPASCRCRAIDSDPSPPIVINASIRCSSKRPSSSSVRSTSIQVPSRLLHRIGDRVATIGGAEDRATLMDDAANPVTSQLDQPTVGVFVWQQQPIETVADPDDIPIAVSCRQGGRANHGVQSRRVAATGAQSDPFDARHHEGNPTHPRLSFGTPTISPSYPGVQFRIDGPHRQQWRWLHVMRLPKRVDPIPIRRTTATRVHHSARFWERHAARRTRRRGDVHRLHHVGEQNRDLLVLRVFSGLGDRCATSVTKPRILQGFDAAHAARQHGRHPTHRQSCPRVSRPSQDKAPAADGRDFTPSCLPSSGRCPGSAAPVSARPASSGCHRPADHA